MAIRQGSTVTYYDTGFSENLKSSSTPLLSTNPRGVKLGKWELRFAKSGISLRFSAGGQLVFTGSSTLSTELL